MPTIDANNYEHLASCLQLRTGVLASSLLNTFRSLWLLPPFCSAYICVCVHSHSLSTRSSKLIGIQTYRHAHTHTHTHTETCRLECLLSIYIRNAHMSRCLFHSSVEFVTHCNTLQRHCSTLGHVATVCTCRTHTGQGCSVLQCVAVRCVYIRNAHMSKCLLHSKHACSSIYLLSIFICVHMFACVCKCVHIYVYVYTYVHIYLYICTHTCIHIYQWLLRQQTGKCSICKSPAYC